MNTRTALAKWVVILPTSMAIACGGQSCRSTPASSGSATTASTPTPITTTLAADEIEKSVDDLVKLFTPAMNRQVEPSIRVAQLQRAMDALRIAARALPRDTFDVQAVVRDVGPDPVKLREWLRANTTWVPYRGVLRGAKGVLMDRVGNSLDRSLLLNAMLENAGVTGRLAHSTLPASQGTSILRQLQAARPNATPRPVESWEGEVKSTLLEYARQVGVGSENVQARLAELESARKRVAVNVATRVSDQTAIIAKAVGPGSAASALEPDVLESARDHWWVQWQNGTEWVDLDPARELFQGAEVSVDQVVDARSLDQSLFHEVEIRIVLEQWDGSALREHRPISHKVRPFELIGEHVQVRHVPIGWREISWQSPDALSRFNTAVSDQREWLPTLQVGERTVIQSSFTDSGNLRTGATASPSGVGDLFGALGAEVDPQSGRETLTAEWIEYEIRAPKEAPRVVRREVFDLIGPARRQSRETPQGVTPESRLNRGLALLGTTDIVILPCQLSSTFLAHLSAERMLANHRPLEAVLKMTGRITRTKVSKHLESVRPLPDSLYALSLAQSQWSGEPGAVYVNQPNVFARHTFPMERQKGVFGLVDAIDIVSNDMGTWPRPAAEAFLARVRQGVLDTNAELTLQASSSGGAQSPDWSRMTDHQPWTAIRSASELDKLSVSADIRARMHLDMQAGYVIVAPMKPPAVEHHYGWWRIDPRTGTTLGVGNRGWGQGAVETAIKIFVVSLFGSLACTFYASRDKNGLTDNDMIVCSMGASAAPLALMTVAGGAGILAVFVALIQTIVTGIDRQGEE